MKKLFFIFSLFLFILFKPQPIFANSNFKTTSHAIYKIEANGNTHTDVTITLENLTAQYYASSYTVSLGFQQVRNLSASDPLGLITPQVTQKGDSQVVTVNFNKKNTGLNSKLTFTLSFDSSDIAKKVGSIWEVNIPGIADQQDFDAFDVDVLVPKSFGQPSFIKPQQIDQSLHFTKEQLGRSGISMAFGAQQTYYFSLTYHLANNNFFPVTTEIALPPQTNYQNVFINTMQPKPTNVIIDKDGNWLAKYYLLPSQKLNVIVKGTTDTSITPQPVYLSEEDKKLYLQEQPSWQISNGKIKTLARQLRTSEAIYDYVVKTLTYDYSRVTQHQQRLGAVNILATPNSAVCLEFTDLFIALARAAGIPAREVDGYAYTQNSKERPLSLLRDILHAWPEYYDNDLKKWIMVDPTWGNTTHGIDYYHTLDFDHFAFAIKGANSSYPVPAGGYKLNGQEDTKDVTVDFSSGHPDSTVSSESTVSLPDSITLNSTVIGKVTIKNNGHRLLPSQKISINASDFPIPAKTITAPEIPPFGTINVPFSMDTPHTLTNNMAVFTIHVADQTVTKTVYAQPLIIEQFFTIRNDITRAFNYILSNITAGARHLFVPGY